MNPRRGRLVLLSGGIASGKSTLAQHLQRAHGFSVVSFGGLVRARANVVRGGDVERTALQEVGAELLASLGASGLVAAAVEEAAIPSASRSVVFDGVRHTEVADAIRRWFADFEVVTVYLAVPFDIRRRRLRARGVRDDSILRWQEHETESQLPLLEASATLVLSEIDPEAAGSRILASFSAGA